MKYNLILAKIGTQDVMDLVNFLNYCRLVLTCDNINMVYVVTSDNLSTIQKMQFLIQTKNTSISYISSPHGVSVDASIREILRDSSYGTILYISGSNTKYKFDTDILLNQSEIVICIIDICYICTGHFKLNYQYDGTEFCQNREEIVEDTKVFCIATSRAHGSSSRDGTREKGVFTLKIIEQRLLNGFLRLPTIENIIKAYDGLEYFMRFYEQEIIIQTNHLDD